MKPKIMAYNASNAVSLRADLEDHIEQCERQYQNLVSRIVIIDQKLDDLEDLILEIKQSLTTRRQKLSK